MIGVVLVAIGNIFQEISDSIGKKQVQDRVASLYTYGFLSLFLGTIFLALSGLVRQSMIFSLASLPTFIPRLVLEILQADVTARAITIADRGHFGFFRALTIPLLLIVDLTLGYAVGATQMLGMALIFLPIAGLMFVEWRQVKGLLYLLFAAVNAVITISLYKYDITYFNSVEAEQVLVGIAVMIYFFAMARWKHHENPLRYLRISAFAAQTGASGFAHVLVSFAYVFAPASIILAAVRASTALFALLSGKFYFRENHFLVRIMFFLLLLLGLVLLAL